MSTWLSGRRQADLLALPEIRDARGSLCVADALGHVPFSIERVYWITDVPQGARRGGHAHRTVSEVLVAVCGSFRVEWEDADGTAQATLRTPADALCLGPLVWREVLAFSPGAVCLVLASGPHDPDEYLRDPDELRRLWAND